jgi:hypothetical protein
MKGPKLTAVQLLDRMTKRFHHASHDPVLSRVQGELNQAGATTGRIQQFCFIGFLHSIIQGDSG